MDASSRRSRPRLTLIEQPLTSRNEHRVRMATNRPPAMQIARRAGGILAGCLTQALFLFTVWHLFWFLKDGAQSSTRGSIFLDVVLALQFVVPHSVLLLPAVKKRLLLLIPAAFYGSFYCVVTCLSLLAVIFFWRACEPTLWQLGGAAKAAVQAGFALSWLALFYSLSLTGLGYQSGLSPWLAWLRRQTLPARAFRPRGAYHYLRHPVYMSFLGLIWLTPRMSFDHLLLTGIWTIYILVGSVLKDRRLLHYLGSDYRQYAESVAGYPFLRFGPLARWPSARGTDGRPSKSHVSKSRRAA